MQPYQGNNTLVRPVVPAPTTQNSAPNEGLTRTHNDTHAEQVIQDADSASKDQPVGAASDDLLVELTNSQAFVSDEANSRVDRYVDKYAHNQHFFDTIMERAPLYMPYIAEQLKEKDLPLELALLPFIESAYDPFAYSSSGAAGLWQFIPSTADHLGLGRSWWYEGRKDVVTSTAAALDYLDYLYKRFDEDWLVALAAYNGGEGAVSRAINKNRELGLPVDYWSLDLSAETRAYVPQFLALTKVLANPTSHGLNLPVMERQVQFDIITLDQQIDLQRAAELANIDIDMLYQLNPGFQRRLTPPSGPYELLLPSDAVDDFKTGLKTTFGTDWLAPDQEYIVQPGDTLSEIAERYQVSEEMMASANQLASSRITDSQVLKIPFADQSVTYKVVTGDTLWGIARKYRVTVKDVAAWNQLPNSATLKPGQKLIIKTRIPIPRADDSAGLSYEVKRGDSLVRISRQFKISIRDIVKWNNLQKQSLLTPGQNLLLHPPHA